MLTVSGSKSVERRAKSPRANRCRHHNSCSFDVFLLWHTGQMSHPDFFIESVVDMSAGLMSSRYARHAAHHRHVR